MSASKEAIEAAARSMAEFNHWDWADLADGYQTSWLKCAENMLTAASPAIQAAALRDAAYYAKRNLGALDDWGTIGTADGKSTYTNIGDWLCARADQLEGKTK